MNYQEIENKFDSEALFSEPNQDNYNDPVGQPENQINSKMSHTHVWNSEEFFFEKENNKNSVFLHSDNFFEKTSFCSEYVPVNENIKMTNNIIPFSDQDMYLKAEFTNEVRQTEKPKKKAMLIKGNSMDKSTNHDSTIKTKDSIDITDALDSIFGKSNVKSEPKKYKIDLAIRKDVVNKNILRIISRYYKDILAEKFKGYKGTFKNAKALDELLLKFCKTIFPDNFDSDLKYSLGAFVLAPKMKNLELSNEIQAKVSQIHKTLSKYTHKDLEKLVNCDRKICIHKEENNLSETDDKKRSSKLENSDSQYLKNCTE
mmetsp:Transcript_29671/g.26259  ORF Transcript_29671/g.26259 Transcript_29671/m.26259 type:complete len:315 (+) Transcript_29671:7-951(+)